MALILDFDGFLVRRLVRTFCISEDRCLMICVRLRLFERTCTVLLVLVQYRLSDHQKNSTTFSSWKQVVVKSSAIMQGSVSKLPIIVTFFVQCICVRHRNDWMLTTTSYVSIPLPKCCQLSKLWHPAVANARDAKNYAVIQYVVIKS